MLPTGSSTACGLSTWLVRTACLALCCYVLSTMQFLVACIRTDRICCTTCLGTRCNEHAACGAVHSCPSLALVMHVVPGDLMASFRACMHAVVSAQQSIETA